MNKYSPSIKYGVIVGILMFVIILMIYFVNVNKLAGFLPMIAYVPLIFTMIWGGITVRREQGAFKEFGQAFLTVFIISISATILFDTLNFTLYKVIDPQIPVIIKAKAIENTSEWLEKMGTTDEKADEAIKRIKDRDFTPTINSQLIRYASSALIGAIFSLVIGLFVNRPDERPVIKAQE